MTMELDVPFHRPQSSQSRLSRFTKQLLFLGLALAPVSLPALAQEPRTVQELMRQQEQKHYPIVPDDFIVSAFATQYYCKRVTGGANPWPPTSVEPTKPAALPAAKLLCDGSNQLIARFPEKTLTLAKYSMSDACRRSIVQFQQSNGCYCDGTNTIKCVTPSLSVETLGARFNMSDRCAQGIQDLTDEVPVKSG